MISEQAEIPELPSADLVHIYVTVPRFTADELLASALDSLESMAANLAAGTSSLISRAAFGGANYKARQLVEVLGHAISAQEQQLKANSKVNTQGEKDR